MNYDHLNLIHEYWRNNIFPNLVHKFSVTSFDEYLKRFAYLPSGKWLKTMEKVKVSRVPFAMIPEEFTKKYKSFSVTYNAPVKPEDGIQRAIYQISPTLHLEAAFWAWIENKVINAYVMVIVCYHDEIEYLNFVDELYKMRRVGNTEDKSLPPGFADLIQPTDYKQLPVEIKT